MAGLTPPRPLAEDDARAGFDCGRDSLNTWFVRHAWGNQRSGASRTSVVRDAETGTVAGYVSLSAAQIERAHLPKPARRNMLDPIPVVLLGQLAVDVRHQGRGLARALLQFALMTALRLSRDIGCYGVLTHPLDEGVRGFYARFGFAPLPFDPKRSLLVRMVDLERNGWGA